MNIDFCSASQGKQHLHRLFIFRLYISLSLSHIITYTSVNDTLHVQQSYLYSFILFFLFISHIHRQHLHSHTSIVFFFACFSFLPPRFFMFVSSMLLFVATSFYFAEIAEEAIVLCRSVAGRRHTCSLLIGHVQCHTTTIHTQVIMV